MLQLQQQELKRMQERQMHSQEQRLICETLSEVKDEVARYVSLLYYVCKEGNKHDNYEKQNNTPSLYHFPYRVFSLSSLFPSALHLFDLVYIKFVHVPFIGGKDNAWCYRKWAQRMVGVVYTSLKHCSVQHL